MLSNIDVAIVTSCKDRDRIYRFKTEVDEKFGDFFELHVVDERVWRFYRRFIDVLEVVE